MSQHPSVKLGLEKEKIGAIYCQCSQAQRFSRLESTGSAQLEILVRTLAMQLSKRNPLKIGVITFLSCGHVNPKRAIPKNVLMIT
jgi:hypothetical protein